MVKSLFVTLFGNLLASAMLLAAERKLLTPEDGRRHTFTRVTISSDGSRIVADNAYHHVWDGSSSTYLGKIPARGVTITRNAKQLIAFSIERVVDGKPGNYKDAYRSRLVDATTLQVGPMIEDLFPVVFSPDIRIAAEKRLDESVVLRDARTFDRLPNPVLKLGEFEGLPRQVRQAAFTPDGKRLWIWTRTGIYIWDVESRKIVRSLEDVWTKGESFNNVLRLSPDGKYAVARLRFEPSVETPGDVDRTDGRSFLLLDIENDYQIRWALNVPAEKIVIAPDSRWIITATRTITPPDEKGRVEATGDSMFRIFDPDTGKMIHTFTVEDHYVTGLDIAADGTLVTCGKEGKVLVWDWKQIEKELPQSF